MCVRNKALYMTVVMMVGKGRQTFGHEREPMTSTCCAVEQLLLHVERSHVMWFRHLVRMAPFGGFSGRPK